MRSAPARSASCVRSNSYTGQDGAAFVLDTSAFEDEDCADGIGIAE
jgi:hypothetical protein